MPSSKKQQHTRKHRGVPIEDIQRQKKERAEEEIQTGDNIMDHSWQGRSRIQAETRTQVGEEESQS
eukprot:6133439-Karenia_brevis.AAC.1